MAFTLEIELNQNSLFASKVVKSVYMWYLWKS